MNIKIVKANMSRSKDKGYLGHVTFEVETHKQPYEITFQSDKGDDDWNYALNFSNEPGSEDEINAIDERLELDDDLFYQLLETAWETLPEE